VELSTYVASIPDFLNKPSRSRKGRWAEKGCLHIFDWRCIVHLQGKHRRCGHIIPDITPNQILKKKSLLSYRNIRPSAHSITLNVLGPSGENPWTEPA
jgi:hypothetical protein